DHRDTTMVGRGETDHGDSAGSLLDEAVMAASWTDVYRGAVVRFTPPYHCGVPVVRKDVTYPLVFSYNRNRAAIPTMAPIPDRP
ncbi:MAG: hypothetical protein AAFY85_10125, partial [Pseudomonadota bacterium]